VSAVAELIQDGDRTEHANFSAALMLGIAYAASVGGVATPIGTPPNIAFQGQFAELFPEAAKISFGQWVLAYIPLVVVFLPVVWLVLVRITCRVSGARLPVGREVVAEDLRRLGPLRGPERTVLIVFLLTAVLWITRSIPIGETNHGWSACLERWLTAEGPLHYPFRAAYINDATVALAMAVLLFVIPAGREAEGGGAGSPTGRRRFLMNWQTAQRLPWGILLLFGGGFSIAAAFRSSGLSYWCGMVFADIGITNPILVVLTTCLLMTFLTEITSNTATTQVMLPILARASLSIGVHPLMLMLPATISASCAFMLPVATPPNAIVFGSGCVPMSRMVRSGIIINFIGVGLVTATFYLFVRPLLGIDLSALPEWAQ
jgi:sodium-dependent dicarboxylate transporter 2/3/5